MVLQENDKQRQRGSGIHECSNSSETISNGNSFPLFRIAGENLEFLDDTNVLPFFHHLKEGVDVQGFDQRCRGRMAGRKAAARFYSHNLHSDHHKT